MSASKQFHFWEEAAGQAKREEIEWKVERVMGITGRGMDALERTHQ